MILDLSSDEFPHGLVVEASAGTGKTYSVAAIVTLELARRDDLRIGDILITTFTRNAAAELRDRVRRRLAETVHMLRGTRPDDGDPVVERLRRAAGNDGPTSDAELAARIRRLERALVEFDSATISTIHGVCARVLRAAGLEVGAISDGDEAGRIVAEVVNDLVLGRAAADQRWNEDALAALVQAKLEDPFVEWWFDDGDRDLTTADKTLLASLPGLLDAGLQRIHAALAAAPGYADLLRLALALVSDETRPELLAALRKRYRLAIVDEAQDTDRQQWKFFERLFPGGDGRALVSVGDPKQAIYGFRGADVRAYVAHAAQARAPDGPADRHRTLTTNRRSDQPLLDALNEAFAGKSFGEQIEYLAVGAPPDRQTALIRGIPGPVEFVELGEAPNQTHLVAPVVGKVIQLLDGARLAPAADPTAAGRPLEPREICVLVRSGGVGRLVERELVAAGIPAVTGGTSSVMHGSMAEDIRSLLEAMERPSSVGRVRRAAATVFFGRSLATVGVLAEDVLEQVQDGLMRWGAILATKGIAALGAAFESNEPVMTRIARGSQGERNVTDFLHVIEVLDSAGPGSGCTPEQALKAFTALAAVDEKHDLVSRRVESDADAVKILTIHAAKGLEFPAVIVADLWKHAGQRGARKPAVFYDIDHRRKVDLGHALGKPSRHAAARRLAAEDEESRRLLYVAATRARHYLAVLVGRGRPDKAGTPPQPSTLEDTMNLPRGLPVAGGWPRRLGRNLTPAATTNLAVAPPPTITQTFRRMSFTGLTRYRRHGQDTAFDPEGGGYDERGAGAGLGAAADPGGTRALIDLPAGVAVGRLIHEIFEHVDTTQRPLADEVRRVVTQRVTAGRLRSAHDALVRIVTDALQTPLGGPFGAVTLGSIPTRDRLAELDFELGLAPLTAGVRANAIGNVLRETLADDDPLREYAATLAGASFDVEVGGLLTGSIDALLRLPGSDPARPRLLLCDYKSNKLHRAGMPDPLRAYAPERLVTAMADAHYPLQFLLYGVAVYRLLRWRLPAADPDDCIAGVVYVFLRGMKGPATPEDERGHRHGVFAWQPPRGLWQALSDVLVTPARAGASA
jgi:exodeoxyribonuclease V beta subunit